MLLCHSFSVLQPTDPIPATGYLGLSLWPVNSQPIRSNLKSLSISQLSGNNFSNELSQNSILAVFSFIMKCDEFFITNESKPFDFPLDQFRDCFEPSGFEHPIALSKNQGFCFILTGKHASVLSRARCISLQQVVTARPLKAGSIFKIEPLFELFPPLSQMSIRFPIVAPPHSKTTFFPTKLDDIKMIKLSKARKQGILWQKQDKIQRWRLDLTPITNSIFVGSSTVAQNGDLLRRKSVTHIINCASQLIVPAQGFTTLNIPMVDGGDENMLSHIWQTSLFIENAIQNGGKILVNCIEGVSRSCSVVIAYLMLTENLDYKTAYNRVRKQRRCCSPHPKFMTQLMQLSEILGTSTTKSCNFSKDKIIPFVVMEKRHLLIPLPIYDEVPEHKTNGCTLTIDYQHSSCLSKFDHEAKSASIVIKYRPDSELKVVQCARENSKNMKHFLNIDSITEEVEAIDNGINVYSSPSWTQINDFVFSTANQSNVYVAFNPKTQNLTVFIGQNAEMKQEPNQLLRECCEANNLPFNENFVKVDGRITQTHVRFS